MKVAAIDLGTNSFLCLIAEKDGAGNLQVIEDICEIVRLGEDVQKTGVFSEGALSRAQACLSEFKKRIDHHKVTNVRAVATSAARDVKNGNVLFEIGKKLNIPIEIIVGEREAELTFKGVLTGQNKNKNFIVVDIGGGSTEFACLKNNKLNLKSLNIGCVRLTEKFLSKDISTPDQIKNFKNHVSKELDVLDIEGPDEIVAVAGTPTTLAAIKRGQAFDARWVENSSLSQEDLKKMIEAFEILNLEDRKKIPGIEPKRADVILAGAIILKMISEKLGMNSVRVSVRGIRFGLAQEMLS